MMTDLDKARQILASADSDMIKVRKLKELLLK